MDLAGAALRRSALPSAAPAGSRGRGTGRRRAPGRVACVGGGGFAEEGHIRYYDAAPAPRRKAVEAVVRDLARLRATGLVAGDAAKEEVLSQATDLLLQQLNQMKDEECNMKEAQKKEKGAMKALKKQQEEAAMAMSCEEEGYSSESSESDREEEPTMRAGQGMAVSAAVPKVVASSVSTVPGAECEKAAMKAMKKMEKERMKAQKKMEKEQKKAAKRAMKMEKEARKMAMATVLNGCRDEDDSSCSSESSDSECEGQVVRMSRCATIAAPGAPSPPTTVLPIIVPQIPAPLAPEPPRAPEPAEAMQGQVVGVSSLAVAEMTSTANRIEVCMGGKCKKAGALALLQEFEKAVGTGGTVAGCKCLGKCGLGPNVRLRSDLSTEGSAKGSPLCIGVGVEDVGTIVAGLFGDGDLGMTPTYN